jgi:hypothetical protein
MMGQFLVVEPGQEVGSVPGGGGTGDGAGDADTHQGHH